MQEKCGLELNKTKFAEAQLKIIIGKVTENRTRQITDFERG
jgi:hypothetical protein